jgi:hypothetical protein
MFRTGNTYGKGRPSGSRNISPDRKQTIILLNKIVQDLSDNYDILDLDYKAKLLSIFRHLWIRQEHELIDIPDNTIKVNIVSCQD